MDTIIVTIITVFGGGILKLLSDWITNTQKNQKELMNQVLNRMDNMELNQEELKGISADNGYGTKNIIRHQLRQEMKKARNRGYESADNFEEVSILYETYMGLGGNGVIKDLYEQYKKLPIKGETEK